MDGGRHVNFIFQALGSSVIAARIKRIKRAFQRVITERSECQIPEDKVKEEKEGEREGEERSRGKVGQRHTERKKNIVAVTPGQKAS